MLCKSDKPYIIIIIRLAALFNFKWLKEWPSTVKHCGSSEVNYFLNSNNNNNRRLVTLALS